ncbi:MAG: hypothetical protein HWQ39_17945 [Nostoc sp. NMS8]|nr:hypothetical protein [Nostoc sp. NMS8]
MIVQTINRFFCVGNRWAYSTFKAVIVSKELATSTGDLMHKFGCSHAISRRRPETQHNENSYSPSSDKAYWD